MRMIQKQKQKQNVLGKYKIVTSYKIVPTTQNNSNEIITIVLQIVKKNSFMYVTRLTNTYDAT